MRRSFILAGLAIACLPWAAGCGATIPSLFQGKHFKLLSAPIETAAAPSTAPAEGRSAPAPNRAETVTESGSAAEDPSVAAVSMKVDEFVARFPSPDLKGEPEGETKAPAGGDGTVAAKPGGAAAKPPAVQHAAESSPPPVVREANAPESAVDGRAGPAVVAAREPAGPTTGSKTNANKSVSVEAVASPEPPKPVAPAPTADGPSVSIVDVRPARDNPAPDSSTGGTANQPAGRGDQPATGDVARMIAQLEEAVRQHPQQLDDQFKLRLLYLATGQKDRAVSPFKDVDPVQAEMMSALFRTIAGAQDSLRDPSRGAAAALGAVEELQRVMSEQSPVVISKLALVTAVNSFGDYKAVNPPLFPKGRPVHVFCYCEIRNFHSEPTQDGRLRTLLAASLEVFDATGKIVWQQSMPQCEDLAYTPRRDFFWPLEVKLPATLPAGDYVLKVTIEDKLGATTDQQRLTLTIGK